MGLVVSRGEARACVGALGMAPRNGLASMPRLQSCVADGPMHCISLDGDGKDEPAGLPCRHRTSCLRNTCSGIATKGKPRGRLAQRRGAGRDARLPARQADRSIELDGKVVRGKCCFRPSADARDCD